MPEWLFSFCQALNVCFGKSRLTGDSVFISYKNKYSKVINSVIKYATYVSQLSIMLDFISALSVSALRTCSFIEIFSAYE